MGLNAIATQNSGQPSIITNPNGAMTSFLDASSKELGLSLQILDQSPSPFTFKIRGIGTYTSPNTFSNGFSFQLKMLFGDGTSVLGGNLTGYNATTQTPFPLPWWIEYVFVSDAGSKTIMGVTTTGAYGVPGLSRPFYPYTDNINAWVPADAPTVSSDPPFFALSPGNRWSTSRLVLQATLFGNNASNTITLTEFSLGPFPN